MRRPAVLVLMVLSASLLALPGRAAPPPTWTSYDVTLAPLPDSLRGCSQGVEKVHKDTRTLVSPLEGRLEVQMLGLRGDFDIGLLDSNGKYVGGGGFGDQTFGPSTSEQASARVHKETRLTVQVCNYSSAAPKATVRYRYVATGSTAVRPARGFRSLAPAQLPDLRERVPVNVVLLGYGSEVSVPALRAALPRVSRPHERFAAFYGYERPLGITYTYDYRFTRASRSYTDTFFGRLKKLAVPRELTQFQQLYNDQVKNRLAVRDGVKIDAAAVERELAAHPPAGVDTRQDTVFLINWWGRKDFRFHVYERGSEAVTDTGRKLGQQDYAALEAWGGSTADDPETGLGTPRRVWFHDLSAGPTYWTGSWAVDSTDVDGDGYPERRMLPTWEYGAALPAAQLTTDLAAIVRYVAVDLLFTPSPLYSVRPQSPVIARSIDIDVNVYDLDPGSTTAPFQPGALQRSVAGISPVQRVSSDRQVVAPTDPVHTACLSHYLATLTALYTLPLYLYTPNPSCQPQYRYGVYDDLFVYAAANLPRFLDDTAKVQREIPVFSYQLPDNSSGCYAYADDNHLDGTPSMVFGFFPRRCRAFIGTTDILTHEAGHELGLSHPHDGYDYEEDRDFGAYGDTFFAGVGDEVSTVMSYLDVNNEYSQFDRDSHARFLTAAHLAEVNVLAAKVLATASPDRGTLLIADRAASRAGQLFSGHRYVEALMAAREAYEAMLRAASAAHVAVIASTAGTDLVPVTAGLGVPKGRGYSRAHAFDPATGLPLRCAPTNCPTNLPPLVTDRGGPSRVPATP